MSLSPFVPTPKFEDALAISDQFPPSFHGIFVMGVNDYKDDYREKVPGEIRHQLDRILLVDAPSLAPFWKEEQGCRSWRVPLSI